MSDHPSVPVRVSVIIAAFNAAQYLHVAVRSVLRQTEQNFEVLIIDDCSRDDTWKIAQDFQKNDSRIRAYRMKKNGSSLFQMGELASTSPAMR
jgi:teichuronic acid biosynthesis glycosyltransferase TuaG